jgi:hypothetical protein
MKLTKKQSEIIAKVKKIEAETKKTVYFMYNGISRKIYAVTVKLKDNNEIDTIEEKEILCTHNVCMTMENKGIIVPETVGKHKRYVGEDTLYDFVLCKVNPVL